MFDMGPGSAPIMQAAFAGVESWFFTVTIPWWSFGERVPKWRQNALIFAKSDDQLWPDYLEECSADFKKWLKSKKKK